MSHFVCFLFLFSVGFYCFFFFFFFFLTGVNLTMQCTISQPLTLSLKSCLTYCPSLLIHVVLYRSLLELVRFPGNWVTRGQWFFSSPSAFGRLYKAGGVVCFHNKLSERGNCGCVRFTNFQDNSHAELYKKRKAGWRAERHGPRIRSGCLMSGVSRTKNVETKGNRCSLANKRSGQSDLNEKSLV